MEAVGLTGGLKSLSLPEWPEPTTPVPGPSPLGLMAVPSAVEVMFTALALESLNVINTWGFPCLPFKLSCVVPLLPPSFPPAFLCECGRQSLAWTCQLSLPCGWKSVLWDFVPVLNNLARKDPLDSVYSLPNHSHGISSGRGKWSESATINWIPTVLLYPSNNSLREQPACYW